MWQITIDATESIAIGAGILGTGGGGKPYLDKIWMQSLLRQGYVVKVIDLDEVADDILVTDVGGMGAPTVGIEKLPCGDEPRWAAEALEVYTGKRIAAIIYPGIGGANSIAPLVAGALTGKPVIDADSMGRAFPEIQMVTHNLFGIAATPFTMADEKGNSAVLATVDNRWMETFARSIAVNMGVTARTGAYAASGKQQKRPRRLAH